MQILYHLTFPSKAHGNLDEKKSQMRKSYLQDKITIPFYICKFAHLSWTMCPHYIELLYCYQDGWAPDCN